MKIMIFVLAFILLISLVNAQNLPIDSDCFSDDECLSEICQGGKCRSEDIILLINNTLAKLEESFEEVKTKCTENWQCTSWSVCSSGSQTRTCTDANKCYNSVMVIQKPAEVNSCTVSAASCTDGIKNQNEEGVDCGGQCPSCSTCYDSMQNCHGTSCEEGVDCGGPCPPCILEEAGSSTAFWITFTSILLIAIVIIVGLLYWKLKGEAKEVGNEEKKWEHKKPPIQPSSLLRI